MITENDLPKGSLLNEVAADHGKDEPCFEMYRRMHVLADGQVGVCVCRDIDGAIAIGDMKEKSLQQIWRGSEIQKFRQDWQKGILPDICGECDRYVSLSDYIKKHKFEILRSHFKIMIRKMKKPRSSAG